MSSKLLFILPLGALAVIAMGNTAYSQIAPFYDPPLSASLPDVNNTISVTGTASEKVEPDRVSIVFAVETIDGTASAALEENSDKMDSVLEALTDAGVQENETSTAYFSIYPNYNYTEFGVEELTGYTVTNSIMVESSKLANVSDWIDVAVNAGANRVDSLSFTLSENRLNDVKMDLMQDAVDDARGKADALAEALNVEVQGVGSAQLYDFGGPPVMPMSLSFASDEAQSITTPITPGKLEVSLMVGISYKIG